MTGPERRVVLCGFDGDPAHVEVLRFALEEAIRRAVPLRVLCAYDRPVDPDIDTFDVTDQELAAAAVEQVERSLARISAAKVDVRAVPGPAGHALLEDAGDAVLIVIGRRRSALERTLFGSQSAVVLRRSAVPVVVVPLDG